MPSLYELSNRLWTGQDKTSDKGCHPFAPLYEIEDVAAGVAFYKGFSNLAAVRTDVGLSLIDTGSFHPVAQGRIFEKVRSWSDMPLHTAVYTHGHADHAYGLPPFLAEAREKGWQEPEIVGHALVRARMDRYILTAGFNSLINTRQFGHEQNWPTDPIYPTKTYDSTLQLEVGGVTFELHHARGDVAHGYAVPLCAYGARSRAATVVRIPDPDLAAQLQGGAAQPYATSNPHQTGPFSAPTSPNPQKNWGSGRFLVVTLFQTCL